MGVGRPEGLARVADKLVLGVCVVMSLWLLSLDENTRVQRAAGWAHRLTTPVEWTIHVVDGAIEKVFSGICIPPCCRRVGGGHRRMRSARILTVV